MKSPFVILVAFSIFFGFEAVDGGLPQKFFDPHHHFYDASKKWAAYLNSLAGNITFYPEDYIDAVVEPIEAAGVDFLGSVIIEALPVSSLFTVGRRAEHRNCIH